jgi:hypothetical protein
MIDEPLSDAEFVKALRKIAENLKQRMPSRYYQRVLQNDKKNEC